MALLKSDFQTVPSCIVSTWKDRIENIDSGMYIGVTYS